MRAAALLPRSEKLTIAAVQASFKDRIMFITVMLRWGAGDRRGVQRAVGLCVYHQGSGA